MMLSLNLVYSGTFGLQANEGSILLKSQEECRKVRQLASPDVEMWASMVVYISFHTLSFASFSILNLLPDV
jgi:hypothetical protein